MPVLEALEARWLLSAKLVHRVLEVKGTGGDDAIQITKSHSSLIVTVGKTEKSFSAGKVQRIRVRGLGGKDTIDTGGILKFNLTVFGGAGDDKITGSWGKDRLVGGDGADSISGDRGDDKLDGGAGNDTLSGGRDDDRLEGGAGADSLHGDDGRDELRGGADNDSLFGDGDNDLLFGSLGNDSLDGGDADDVLDGGDGNDTLFDHAGSDILRGQAGDDSLDSSDGTRGDGLNGGLGTNTITKDALDFESVGV